VILTIFFGLSLQGERGAVAENPGEEVSKGNSTDEQVNRLSVGEAVGQMFMVSMDGTQPDSYIEKMIKERNVGGVILFGRNIESEEQTQSLTSALQDLSMHTPASIPLLIAADQEGGRVARLPWIIHQPAAAVVGQSGDPAWAYQIAKVVGQKLREDGINTNLAPVVDAGFGAAIGDRSFSVNPILAASMGSAAIEGYNATSVVSSAKHFPNHGPAEQDSHDAQPIIWHDTYLLQNQDLPPFRAAIGAKVPMVMVGHLVYLAIDPELPASLSPRAMNLLREDLGFKGVIITDDLNMEGAKRGGTVAEAALEAVEAGADMLLVTGKPQQQADQEQTDAYDAVLSAVQNGQISRQRIDASVKRILTMKEQYQIMRPQTTPSSTPFTGGLALLPLGGEVLVIFLWLCIGLAYYLRRIR
jgi:beta-N-acetylhexosaminidase